VDHVRRSRFSGDVGQELPDRVPVNGLDIRHAAGFQKIVESGKKALIYGDGRFGEITLDLAVQKEVLKAVLDRLTLKLDHGPLPVRSGSKSAKSHVCLRRNGLFFAKLPTWVGSFLRKIAEPTQTLPQGVFAHPEGK